MQRLGAGNKLGLVLDHAERLNKVSELAGKIGRHLRAIDSHGLEWGQAGRDHLECGPELRQRRQPRRPATDSPGEKRVAQADHEAFIVHGILHTADLPAKSDCSPMRGELLAGERDVPVIGIHVARKAGD
jgi:hypothetical protein